MNKGIEILAPVGSFQSLKAAVLNGANAVYLGGKLFNARHYASNFSNEELLEAVRYAHLRDAKVYVTVNILMDESEIEDALDYVTFLYEIGVDAIIVQDLGFAMLVKDMIPNMPLHASTQMTVNNLEGVKYLEALGFERVVLARETPIEEIKYIKANSNIELEGFIHGALCISYSGQCLMSSLIGGRSGNRGTCAQPCRMEYTVLDEEDKALKNWDSGYYLSTKDLNTLEHIKEIIDGGIVSLKIEGRMKRPEYVATVVKTYRKALDLGSEYITPEDKADVKQIFNREFTKGVGLGDFGRSFVSTDRPDNRGVTIGKISNWSKKGIVLHIYNDLNIGDGLEWQDQKGNMTGYKVDKNYKKGEKVHIPFAPDGQIGGEVRRTLSSRLMEDAQDTFENRDKEHFIHLDTSLNIDQAPILRAYMKDIVVEVTGDESVQKAYKAPLTKEKVFDQLSKLGNTTFKIKSININLDENAFIPVSKLNELRRSMVIELEERLLEKFQRPEFNKEYYDHKKSSLFEKKAKRISKPKLSIKVSNQKQFDQLNLEKVDRVYISFNDNLMNNILTLRRNSIEVFYWTDKILYSHDLDKALRTIKPVEDFLDGISVSNIGSFEFFKDNFKLGIHCDIGLNVFNSVTADHLSQSGANSVTLSPELNLKQIKKISNKLNLPLEGIVYGYLPSMILKNCPMATFKGCKDDSQCESCNFAHGYKLKDRMGKTFMMERFEGYSTIYNSVPLFLLDKLQDVVNTGIDILRLDFTVEGDIEEIQSYYYDSLNNNMDREAIKNYVEGFKEKSEVTNGHYYRGVL